MSRELTRNERRLAMLAVAGLFWGAFLVALGFTLPFVVVVLGALFLAAAIGLQGRALGAAARALSARAGRIDWAAGRDAARRRATAARDLAAESSKRALAAGGTAVAAIDALRARPAEPGRREAMRLSQQAAVLRAEERLAEAVELGEQALAIFRSLEDAHGAALTLNGLGLTQARMGDETGALDSYEAAIALLTEIGDSHGAGRVLANLGALHRGQGHDAAARAAWSDALERLEPGTPEHDRMAQQLKLAS